MKKTIDEYNKKIKDLETLLKRERETLDCLKD